MTKLYAQPYDISAAGFYFDEAEIYEQKVEACLNDYGQQVEEFEIQFIDGDQIDCAFANAFELNQCNFAKFFELVDEWDDQQKTRFIIANGECGYNLNPETDNIDDLDIDIHDVQSLKELAEQFIDEGLFGEIPKSLEFYIDHEAIARDLAADYSMTEVAGERFAYAHYFQSNKDQAGFNCTLDYSATGNKDKWSNMMDFLGKHPDKPLGGVLFVYLRKKCEF